MWEFCETIKFTILQLRRAAIWKCFFAYIYTYVFAARAKFYHPRRQKLRGAIRLGIFVYIVVKLTGHIDCASTYTRRCTSRQPL